MPAYHCYAAKFCSNPELSPSRPCPFSRSRQRGGGGRGLGRSRETPAGDAPHPAPAQPLVFFSSLAFTQLNLLSTRVCGGHRGPGRNEMSREDGGKLSGLPCPTPPPPPAGPQAPSRAWQTGFEHRSSTCQAPVLPRCPRGLSPAVDAGLQGKKFKHHNDSKKKSSKRIQAF